MGGVVELPPTRDFGNLHVRVSGIDIKDMV